MTCELEQAGDRVAVCAVPRRGNSDRAGRVRGDHLDLDPLAWLGLARAEIPTLLADRAQGVREPGVAEPQVDEARPGDLRPLDRGYRHRGGGDLFRQLAWRLAPLGREPECRIRGVVAVRRVARTFELEFRADSLAQVGSKAGDRVSGRQRPRPT